MPESQESISLTSIDTPLGKMCCGIFQEKLVLLEFENEKRIENQTRQLKEAFHAQTIWQHHSLANEVERQLMAYFSKKQQAFSLPTLLTGSDFQIKVWESLLNIPYGKTVSYQQQAVKYGNLKAIRAVAKANGENRIAIVIPCHRVIGSNGELTGYAGELWRKKSLLELEGALARQETLF